MPTVRVNGVELYYEVTGAGERLVLTHGSWTDATGWAPVVEGLTRRYEVVTWDRRGHSRSQAGDGPGSRAEDAADLAALIEHLGGPVHLAGNSFGTVVTLTLVTARPDLAITAAGHEPPLWDLLEGTADATVTDALGVAGQRIGSVAELIAAGEHRRGAERFVDDVAFGPGSWERLPEPRREAMAANAPTFLDEVRDPTAREIDVTALATNDVPLLLTLGTESPPLFPAVIAELTRAIPSAQTHVYEGAGHVPHTSHPDEWVARLMAFHDDAGDRETGKKG